MFPITTLLLGRVYSHGSFRLSIKSHHRYKIGRTTARHFRHYNLMAVFPKTQGMRTRTSGHKERAKDKHHHLFILLFLSLFVAMYVFRL